MFLPSFLIVLGGLAILAVILGAGVGALLTRRLLGWGRSTGSILARLGLAWFVLSASVAAAWLGYFLYLLSIGPFSAQVLFWSEGGFLLLLIGLVWIALLGLGMILGWALARRGFTA